MTCRTLSLIMTGILLFAATVTSLPKDAPIVEPFDYMRYLGKWYEIARFDFKFEKNLNNTTAEYAISKNGSFRVVNKGYDTLRQRWKKAVGKARFREKPITAKLKVSFCGPFYGEYNVLMIDSEYKYALIAGKNLKYLWLLSREKTIPDHIRLRYLDEAKRLGYPIENLIWVQHNREE